MIKISKTDILWNYIGSFFNIGFNIIVLPLILKLLNQDELALWYIFLSIMALITLLDFGFSPTIMRNITYGWSGAKRLKYEGTIEQKLVGPNYELVFDILNASRVIFLILSIVSAILLLLLGTPYISSLVHSSQNEMILAWYVFVGAVVVNMYYGYWSPALRGIGSVKESNYTILISKLVYVSSIIIGLKFHAGLLWLTFSYLLSGVTLRVFSKYYFSRKAIKPIYYKFNLSTVRNITMIIWPNAKKLGIVSIGAWLTSKATTLIVSTTFSLATVSAFGLTLQLLTIINSLGGVLFSSYLPELASLRISNDVQRSKYLLSQSIFFQLLISICGLIFVVFFGEWFIHLIKPDIILLSKDLFFFLGVILILEANHSIFATYITLSNKVPFVNASIITGLSIIFLSYLGLKYIWNNIALLIIIQGVMQLLYNNWKWPHYVMIDLDSNYIEFIINGYQNTINLVTHLFQEFSEKRKV